MERLHTDQFLQIPSERITGAQRAAPHHPADRRSRAFRNTVSVKSSASIRDAIKDVALNLIQLALIEVTKGFRIALNRARKKSLICQVGIS